MNTCGYRIIKWCFSQLFSCSTQREGGEEKGKGVEGKKEWKGGGRGEEEK